MEIHQNHPSHLHSASGVANGDLKTRREVSEVDRGGGAMEMRNRKSGGSESDTDEAILLQGNSSIMREGKLQGMSQVLELFKELTVLSNLIIMWIVDLAPFCIAFLIAGSLAEAGNLIALMRSVAVYVLATLTGIFIHICVTLPLVFFLYTGDNPYEWLSSCQKAMLVALSTSSS
ncbi:SLC1A6, partial [Symbiodinium microadriaticum]